MTGNAAVLGDSKREPEYSKIEIWCDKNSDMVLLDSLRQVSPLLSRVRSINVLPSNVEIKRSARLAFLRPLLKYDRPDYLIFYRGHPAVVVELTEHGYSGDMSLQRFARLVSAGEEGVPVLYFTPFSRTRIDEIEATDEDTSRRRVSLNLFKGASRIYQIHGVPVILLDWKTNARGLPMPVGLTAAPEKKLAVYGELLWWIDHLITQHADAGHSLAGCKRLKEALLQMDKVASKLPLRDSEVKIQKVAYSDVASILERPSNILRLMKDDYFFKGKAHKLVALLALQKASIIRTEHADGKMVVTVPGKTDFSYLPNEITRRPSLVYFSGYEKRSEPNGGIIANIDYLYCRTGTTVTERSQNLVVVWPRVFFDAKSKTALRIKADIRETVSGSTHTELAGLLKRRESLTGERAGSYIQDTASSIGYWKENDTIGGICRKFCDLLVLNDAVLLGDIWKTHTNKGNGQTRLS